MRQPHPEQELEDLEAKGVSTSHHGIVYFDEEAEAFGILLNYLLQEHEVYRLASEAQVVRLRVQLHVVEEGQLVKEKDEDEDDVVNVWPLVLHYGFRH